MIVQTLSSDASFPASIYQGEYVYGVRVVPQWITGHLRGATAEYPADANFWLFNVLTIRYPNPSGVVQDLIVADSSFQPIQTQLIQVMNAPFTGLGDVKASWNIYIATSPAEVTSVLMSRPNYGALIRQVRTVMAASGQAAPTGNFDGIQVPFNAVSHIVFIKGLNAAGDTLKTMSTGTFRAFLQRQPSGDVAPLALWNRAPQFDFTIPEACQYFAMSIADVPNGGGDSPVTPYVVNRITWIPEAVTGDAQLNKIEVTIEQSDVL